MSVVDTAVAALGAGTIPTVIAELARRSSNRRKDRLAAAKTNAADVKEKARVDGVAYDRALEINERIVADLEAQVERLRKELAEMRVLLRTAQQNNVELERKVTELERTVEHMSELLAQHNIDPGRRPA